MASPRLPDKPTALRRRAMLPAPLPPVADAALSPRHLLLKTWQGRLFLISTGLKLLVAALRAAVGASLPLRVLSSAASIGLVIAVAYFVWRLYKLMKRRLLWRVRRKLILSYIFVGVMPALLIAVFFLLGATLVALSVSAYLFKDGYDEISDHLEFLARSAAADIARQPGAAPVILERASQSGQQRYPGLSLVFIPEPGVAAGGARAGRWRHVAPPSTIPAWVRADGFYGGVAIPKPNRPGESEIIVRAAVPARTAAGRIGLVVADVPLDEEALEWLHDDTGVLAGRVVVSWSGARPALAQDASETQVGSFAFLRNSVAFLDSRAWDTGATGRTAVSLNYRVRDLYRRLSRAQPVQSGGGNLGDFVLWGLLAVAVLFLIIQGVALIMGVALARSITSSIHELFMGTEQVRQGDFTHRITVASNDQLGELAGSFNQMTASIEGLLQTAAEKKRLEEELRIARQIQMSLLPRGPLNVEGLEITALCVPAREVGGDYYDFFPLSDDKLGVLIADVSGKGTSAALYMAELKGVVLALSRSYESPRELLIAVNRIISDNLDSRSFITVTYAVIDRRNGVMTYCRAGHTPLIFLGGPANRRPGVRVLTPSGMVLGLRIDGAEEMFANFLEEERVELAPGDVIVLYTDGITEAMNVESDLFGDERLGRIVEEHGHLDSEELRERILREIEAFVGSSDQHDDMTMILLKFQHVFAAAALVAV